MFKGSERFCWLVLVEGCYLVCFFIEVFMRDYFDTGGGDDKSRRERRMLIRFCF